MAIYERRSEAELKQEYCYMQQNLKDLKARNLKLNMARGKPGKTQLDMVSDILGVMTNADDCMTDGIDARNYGEMSGLPAAKQLFAELLGCKPEQCLVGGNASLQLMYGTIAKAFTHGLKNSPRPWSQEKTVKWLCPAPGYDRHFKISESFGMELLTIPMTAQGPDMDMVERLIKDEQVKGIWCVPKYSNPDGIIYSDEVIERFAALKPAAPDFALMWDNAYCVHEFEGDFIPFRDILSLCAENGNEDMVYEYASTSKITFPGAGVSVLAASESNLKHLIKLFSIEIISFDKLNQLRHVKYLQDKEHTLALMKRHAALLKPKFGCVLSTLEKELAPLGIASWNKPKGGYFVSVNTKPGLAKRTLELCKQAGVIMTGAGATYPYGIDPQDSNIRIAPTMPSVEELCVAMEVFCTCLKLAALEQLLKR